MNTSVSQSYWKLIITICAALMAGVLLGQQSVLAASPDDPPYDFSMSAGETHFVLTYEDTEPPESLIRTLSNLQHQGKLTILDAHFGDGGILIRIADTKPEALIALEGVTALAPIDIPALQEDREDSSTIQPLAGTGAVTGTVTAENTGLPLDGVSVYIYPAGSYSSVGYDWTDTAGTFGFSGLDAGNYQLYFIGQGQYAFEWYNNALDRDDADIVTVTDATTTKINIQLARGGIITGVVTDESTGLPLSDIDVWARHETGSSFWTDSFGDGSYSIDGLAVGSYTVCFQDSASGIYAPECYDDKPYEYGGADSLLITAGVTLTGINASLARAATITGTVTDAATGDPLQNVTVGAYDPSNSWYPIEDATTDVSGTYRISGLAPGEYKLRFTDNDDTYLESYYDGQETFAAADPVTLTAGMTTTVDVAMTKGGHIAGRVVDADTDVGINNVRVVIRTLDYERSFYTWTTSDGTYTSPALPTGGYVVNFEPPLPYFDETYDNLVTGYTPVWVTVPDTTSDIDAALRKGYVITGTVTGDQGVPLQSVHVRPYSGGSSYYDWDLADYTASDGTYALGPLSSGDGDYRVRFLTPDSSSYAPEWYNDAITYGHASRVTVPVTGPIDAQLSAGGYISGVVTATDETPVEDVYVYIYEPGSSTTIRSTTTDEEGAYATGPLPTGNYQVRFSNSWDSTYVYEWYDDQSAQEDAALVSVSAGNTTGHIDAQLALTSEQPSGHILIGPPKASDSGEFLEDVTVYSYTSDPEVMEYHGQCPQDGPLDIVASPGTYHLYFVPPEPYSPMFYENAYVPTDADPVTVTVDVTTTIASPMFQIGGNISGTVTAAADGTPLRGSRVEAELQDSAVHAMGGGIPHWSYFKKRDVFADAHGRYHLVGLAPGQYRVTFYPPSPYIEAPHGSGNVAQSVEPLAETFVDVNLGETTPDVDAALQEGGVITGMVTAAEDGRPFMGTTVEVYDADQALVASTSTDMDGVYTTPGLPAGDYKVFFPGPFDYISRWNEDADAFETAPTINVSAPGTVADVNAALVAGGKLSGYVYDKETRWPLPLATVEFYSSAGTLVEMTWANSWGYYESPGLPADAYTVAFSKDGYLARWYDDASAQADATSVNLVLGERITGIDVYLDPLGHQVFLPLVLRTP